MNIPQMRSDALKIKKRLDHRPSDINRHLSITIYRLTDLVENIINAMDEPESNSNEKGSLVSEISVGGGTYRTYLTKKS